jgi:hypothetical protein
MARGDEPHGHKASAPFTEWILPLEIPSAVARTRNGLPVIVRPCGAFDESCSGVSLAQGTGEIRPATLQCPVQAVAVMVAVHVSIRSVRLAVTSHHHWTRFHHLSQPPPRFQRLPVLSQWARNLPQRGHWHRSFFPAPRASHGQKIDDISAC